LAGKLRAVTVDGESLVRRPNTRVEPVADAVVLAAIERAARHEQLEGVQWSRIVEHLGFVHGPWTTRSLRPQVDTLIAAGLVERSVRHGSDVWGLTRAGRVRLAHIGVAGDAVELPEAPQHRKWRHAQVEASSRIEVVREHLRRTLEDATVLLDGGDADSEAWFEMSARLQEQCKRLGCATYCLHEWAEPDDSNADVDEFPLRRRLDLLEVAG
jgi:hypothetical protein